MGRLTWFTSGDYRLIMQGDGNLNFVVHRVSPRVGLWASNTVDDWDDDATVPIVIDAGEPTR